MRKSILWVGVLLFAGVIALSSCHRHKIDIQALTQKMWFLRTYERWDTDNRDRVIPESYRSWTYYGNEGYENWFFYFVENNVGYQYHTYQGDTIVYVFNYFYYPEGDSLNIIFETVNDSVENYHATIDELTDNTFTFTNPYHPHQYEQLHLVNVTGEQKSPVKVNPKSIATKPHGPLIPVN